VLTRVGAVATKEFWGLVRQPQLLVLLLVGPVLIMTAFGLSLDVENILRPRAVVVVEPGSEGAELFERFREEFTDRTQFVRTTDDLEAARQRLLRGEVDAVIAIPPDPLGTVAGGRQAVLRVLYDTINPVFGTRVPSRSYSLVLDLNQSLVQAAIEGEIGEIRSAQDRIAELNRGLERGSAAAEALSSEEARAATAELDEALTTLGDALRLWQATGAEGERDASTALEEVETARRALEQVREAQEGGPEEISERSGLLELRESLTSLQEALGALPAEVPARVLANPFALEAENLASPPRVVGFYSPAVLAILIQHIAVSLASLALLRERLSGADEFFEVSPLGPGQLLAGKFLTYFGLVLGTNLAVAIALSGLVGIPVEGGFPRLILGMALLTVASLGLGFLVSALARSELQAVQVSMLLLIASGFFAGFLFPLGQMKGPATVISHFLPATYGIRGLQDVMIRGEGISGLDLAGLVLMAVFTLGLTRYLIGRKKPRWR
jgi:ABC-2 type transport system permease protein